MATEYGNRLRTARKLRGLTQVELSKVTGIAQSTISTAEREGTKSLETTTYATVLKVRPEWLAGGEGDMELPENQKTIREPSSIQGAVTEIPLLNKETAGMFRDYLDGTTPPTETHYHPSNGKGLFAFSVDDDLMEPRVPKGCRAIISTRIKPRHGMCVLVSDGQTSYIRKLTIDGGSQYLEATNTKMPARPLTETIIGVVHQVSILFVDLFEGEEE